jgi:glycosyltransferase involved in cell wall biosynthesis
MNKRRYNVVFLDFDDIKNPLLNAGQARATYEVGTRLAKMGYIVTVYCSRYPGFRDRIENGIRYRHISLGTRYIRLNNLFYILTLPFYVRQIKADIIIESFVAPISTLCSPLFTKVPVIGLPSMFNAKAFFRKYHIPFHWVERFGSRVYKYFLPYSDIDSAKMRLLNPGIRYKIVPQGVDDEYFRVKHNTPKHILFLSRLDIEQKGIDLLLESYARVKNKIPYPLVIAGHGPDREKVVDFIKRLGLQKDVKLVGSAYGVKKKKLIADALYVVFPSRHDELSLWALEAFASGMPIVAFDLPEATWMSKKASLKAKPYDIDEYASLLLKAANPSRNRRMRIEARKLARAYTWKKVVILFDEFISEILKIESSK